MSEREEYKRELGNGRALWLDPQLFGAFMLSIGPVDSEVYDDQWQYQDAGAALAAFALWNPAETPEPDGWYRHPMTGRRRPDGDASREYIHF